jgi:hypothetical protein
VVSLVGCYRSQEEWVSVQMSVALVPQRPSARTCKMGIFKSGGGLGIKGDLKIAKHSRFVRCERVDEWCGLRVWRALLSAALMLCYPEFKNFFLCVCVCVQVLTICKGGRSPQDTQTP